MWSTAFHLGLNLPQYLRLETDTVRCCMTPLPTLLGATYCVRLVTVLRCAATCWVLLAQVWPFSNLANNTQHVARGWPKRTQHVAPNNVAICCVGMLRSFGPGLKLKVAHWYLFWGGVIHFWTSLYGVELFDGSQISDLKPLRIYVFSYKDCNLEMLSD